MPAPRQNMDMGPIIDRGSRPVKRVEGNARETLNNPSTSPAVQRARCTVPKGAPLWHAEAHADYSAFP